MLRIGLIFASLMALAGCAGGSQGGADTPTPECRPWRDWQETNHTTFHWRLRFCGYDEAQQEQVWQAQFRNEHHNGISFSYGLGEDPRRYRMDLALSRTRSSILIRVYAADPNQMVWVHFEGYCRQCQDKVN